MSPSRAQRPRRGRRLTLTPVPRWFPGRGSAFVGPPVRIFYASRIRANLGWWKAQGAPRKIVAALSKGVKLEFSTTPQPFKLSPLLVADGDVDFAIADLEKGDSLGAYQPLLPGGENFLCRSRVDTRDANGKKRVVHNYRKMNEYARKQTCRYENVKDLHNLLRPHDWMLSLDISGAFWHVPLHPATAHYLSFHFALPEFVTRTGEMIDGVFVHQLGGRLRRKEAVPLQPGAYWVTAADGSRYQVVERSCAALPFGYTNSPFIWTKVIKVLAKAMRQAGIRCLWFIDDALCALPSRAAALAARDLIEEMFCRSGLTKAPDKGVWEPTQVLPDHLGFEIATASARGHLKVPARRCEDIQAAAQRLIHHSARHRRRVCSETLRRFIGKASSVSAACDQTRFRLRALHDVAELWASESTLSRAALRDLSWWTEFAYSAPSNGVPLWPEAPTRAIYTDASSTLGFGAVLSAPAGARKAFGGWWTLPERMQWHITMKELVAVRKGVEMYADDLRGHVVRLWEDNQAVVHIIRNKTSASPVLMAELRLLLALLDSLHIILRPKYIRSELNPADEFSRLTDRDAWCLRPSLQRMLMRKVFNVVGKPVTLDAFACHQSAVCRRYASRRGEPAALAFDGLALDWRDEVVWLNPPWALLGDIIGKLAIERPAGVLIVPCWPSQTWWPSLLALGGRHLDLPRPTWSVKPMHNRPVEPLLHHGLRLRAVVLERGNAPLHGLPLDRTQSPVTL